jgi:uncharacterized protein (TIGR02301 family)
MKLLAGLPRLIVVGFAASLAVGVAAPARSQFFFPFFDNRPSPPRHQYYGLGLGRRHSRDVIDLRRRRARQRAKARKGHPPLPAEAVKTAVAPNAPVVEGPPPPYEPQLLRLSEIMGALAYLQTLCGGAPHSVARAEARPWRERMENLITAEAAGPKRRAELAGAYNRGLKGYQYSYRTCTPNARMARSLFLDEGMKLAHDISTQYRAN